MNTPTPTPTAFSSRSNEMDRLEAELKNFGIDVRVTELDGTTVVLGYTDYVEFLFAKSLLSRKGWRVIRPGAQSARI